MLRGLASLVLLLVTVLGVPVALVGPRWQSAARHGLLGWRSVDALLTPDDGTILIGLITVVGWAAWLVFTVSVVSELIALVSRQRIRITLPGLAGPQRMAAGLLLVGDRPGCGSAADPGSAEPDGGRDSDQTADPRAAVLSSRSPRRRRRFRQSPR